MTQLKITKSKALGNLGEEEAARHLERQGYFIVAKNWRCKFGELDLVVGKTKGIIKKKLTELVFVEVKSGFCGGQIGPEQNIRQHKKQRMQRAINVFLSSHKEKIPENVVVRALALVILFKKDYKLEEIKEYLILF